jgi:predicted nucleic acid-binding protein
MPTFVVDSSTIISCAMNCLLWVFDELHKKGIRFVIPKGVRKEIIDTGLSSKRFKYEAIRVLRHINKGTFEEIDEDIKKEVSEMLQFANSSFFVRHRPLKILHPADAQVAVLAKKINADAILTDERTLRLLVEAPQDIKKMLERRLHEKVTLNERNLYSFNKNFENILVARSVDLISLAYDIGIFNDTLKRCNDERLNCKKDLIEGILYSLRFSGCAVSFKEIEDYVNILKNIN